MFCDAAYRDTYDLYRPTLTITQARTQKVVMPDSATSTGNICRFIEQSGSGVRAEDIGLSGDYDAIMYIPLGHDLRPAQRGDDADVVLVSGRYWTVLRVWETAGNNGQKVALQEKRID